MHINLISASNMQQEKNCACADNEHGHDMTLSDIRILGEFCKKSMYV